MHAPKAMILAAGRGERMRPLTDRTPKPLLAVHGRPLIEWHLLALAGAGVREVVINTAWLEEQFPRTLGDGSRFGLTIRWSMEGRDHGGALETAGGIAKALPMLGETFWVVSGDVYLPGFGFDPQAAQGFAAGSDLAHLWLVPNPAHHPQGDFALGPNGQVLADGPQRLTWASVGLFRPEMFAATPPGSHERLRPLLDRAIAAGRLRASCWAGRWLDVGTPERLAAVNAETAASP
jgi:MurNAc alpha-1-phosphate uridylyltransferase